MYTETALFDLLLPDDSRSLKQKRSYVRPIIAMLRRFEVSVAEVGFLDRYGRAQIGVAAVAADAAQARRVIDTCEHQVAGRPEVELLSVRRRLHGDDECGVGPPGRSGPPWPG
jgi:uncharacterized protein YlxP (DUF503 family)